MRGGFGPQQINYAGILNAGRQLVPNLREVMLQDAVLTQRQREMEMREQQFQQQLRAAEQQQQRQAEFEQARDQVLLNPTPENIFALQARFPEMSEGMVEAFDRLDERTRQAELTAIGTIFSRARAGDLEGAASVLRDRIEADRAAGQADPRDEAILSGLESDDPAEVRGAIGTVGMTLAGLTGDKFGENFARFDEEITETERLAREAEARGDTEAARRIRENASDPLVQIAGPAGTTVIPRSQATGQAPRSQSRGGDPSGSGERVFSFDAYQSNLDALGPERTTAWASRNDVRVSVNSLQQAQSLPPGTRYVTPDGRRFTR